MQKRKRARRTLAIGAVIVALLLVINAKYPSLLARTELQLFDLRLRALRRAKPVDTVAIAAVDDKSLKEIGEWPWPRAIMGRLVAALKDYRVKAIGFDVVFGEPDGYDLERKQIIGRLRMRSMSEEESRAIVGPRNDDLFAQALRAQGAAIMGFPFESHDLSSKNQRYSFGGFVGTIVPPPPMEYGMVRGAPGAHPAVPTAFGYLPDIPVIREAARGSAYFDANSDPDAVIRSQMMVIRFNAHYYLPLSVAMVASLFPHPPLISLGLDSYGVAGVSISNEEIPVDDLGQMLINFRGPGNTFPRYSAVDIIEHRIPAAELAEKLVLVGVTARGLGDRVSTPFDEDSPGVEVHANVIDNLITGDFLHRLRLNELFARISACVIGLAVSLAVAFLTERQSAVAAALLAVGYLALAQLALAYLGLVLNVLLPLFTLGVTYTGLAGYRYATEGVEKRRLRLAFEHYLHPQVIESILDKPDTVKLGGELRYISILFADIINYTARAEREKPEDLVALLNAYLTTVTDLILRSGGVVDKIRGDGVMAFWGAPAEVPNPSRLAIDCALAMLEELKMLRDRDPRFADVDIGIGIATGEAVVGNFGGERRFDYSAIGDTVNLASRFESLTRQFKAHLLVTEAAFTEADGLYIAREVGLVKVKGRAQVVRMIEVIGGKIGGKDDGIDVGFYDGFTQALMLVRGGQSHEARGALERLLKDKPSDQVVRMYLDRLCSVSDGSEHEVVFEFDSK